MGQLYFEFHFAHSKSLTLEKSKFIHPLLNTPIFSHRGRSSAYGKNGSFIWTAGVKGVATLVLRAAARVYKSEQIESVGPDLIGGAGSIAASLDYSLSKEPQWLGEMFGLDSEGRPLLRRLISCTNPNRKRGDKVAISLKKLSEPSMVRIVVDGKHCTDPALLYQYADTIEFGGSDSPLAQQLHASSPPHLSLASDYSTDRITADDQQSNGMLCLEELYVQHVQEFLRMTNIFDRNILRREMNRFFSNSYIASTIGTDPSLFVNDIDSTLRQDERLGLPGAEQPAFGVLQRHGRLSLAIEPSSVGPLVICSYLKYMRGLHLDIYFDFSISHDISQQLSRKDFQKEEYDFCHLATPVAARLLSANKACDYAPMIITPGSSYRIMAPQSAHAEPQPGGYYNIISHVPSNCMMYYQELLDRKWLHRNRLAQVHLDHDEMVSAFQENNPDLRAILWFPYNELNRIVNGARFLDMPWNHCALNDILLAHQRIFAKPQLARAFNIVFRAAWLTMREQPSLLRAAVQHLLSNELYRRCMYRTSGIHSIIDYAQWRRICEPLTANE